MERLEKDFQKSFLAKLRRIPLTKWAKINDRTTIGMPDLFGVVDGLPVLLELKRKGERATHLQVATLQRYAKAGALVGIVDEVAGNAWYEALMRYVAVRLSYQYADTRIADCFAELDKCPARLMPKKSPALAKEAGEKPNTTGG